MSLYNPRRPARFTVHLSTMIFHKSSVSALALATLLFAARLCCADPGLPALFTNHSVVQRNAPVRVWGTADAGEAISVSLNGRTAAITTAADGTWTATLPSMMAGGPFTLRVSGKSTIVVDRYHGRGGLDRFRAVQHGLCLSWIDWCDSGVATG